MVKPIYGILKKVTTYDCWGRPETEYIHNENFYENEQDALDNLKDGKIIIHPLKLKTN